jgi:hypothetical protein
LTVDAAGKAKKKTLPHRFVWKREKKKRKNANSDCSGAKEIKIKEHSRRPTLLLLCST